MCGRFGLWASPKNVAKHFQLQEPLPFTPRYNIAPSQEIMAVGQTREGMRKAAWLRWGLVPHWAKDEKVGYKMINARAESIFTKPAYKAAAKRHRCLIPASCKKIDSCTIVTTRANEAVAGLHDRMPVIVGQADFDLWLDRSVEDPERLLPLLDPVSDQELNIYPVGLGVNSPANDSEEVIKKTG